MPSSATKALVAKLRAQAVACSLRRLEDWRRVGLVPPGLPRSLGRGRGTEVVYPDDIGRALLSGATRVRRGEPWQVVAFSPFAGGVELPEETIRAAYVDFRTNRTCQVRDVRDPFAGKSSELHFAGHSTTLDWDKLHETANVPA